MFTSPGDRAGRFRAYETMLVEEQLPMVASTIRFDVSRIPQPFTNLTIIFRARTTDAITGQVLRLFFNGDTGANYDVQSIIVAGTSITASEAIATATPDIVTVCGASSPSGAFGMGEILIPAFRSGARKGANAFSHHKTADSSGGLGIRIRSTEWRNTAPIDYFNLTPGGGNIDTGSKFSLYAWY